MSLSISSIGSSDDDPEKRIVIVNQVGNIYQHVPKLANAIFVEATGKENAWKGFAKSCNDDSLFDEIAGLVSRYGEQIITNPEFLSGDFYGLVLELWGTLVLADKTSAAGAPLDQSVYQARSPEAETLQEYIQDLEAGSRSDIGGTRTERLNHFRSQARQNVLEQVPKFVKGEESVATITLPTGMGKTLTGLSAAFSVRDHTGGDRVIYALPFTSIIDQVAAEVKDIFQTDGTDGLLALHHHLGDTQIHEPEGQDEDRDYEKADWNDDVAGMLGESWRAGLTITTFVQLFESLAGPRNTQSMKIPALRGSVVVLDEPQSLPLSWWKLVPRLVKILTEQYGATVIAMTATQPELFPSAQPLVENPDEYFSVAERVRYKIHDSVERRFQGEGPPLEYEPAADELASQIEDGVSVLSICNTIDSARRLTETVTERISTIDLGQQYFELLKQGVSDPIEQTIQLVQSTNKRPFLHLSTRLRPTDRLALIKIAKLLRDDDTQVIAITTQLVEAGVDISFEAVYRDLAPVDSIVQAAGRCNRSFEREYGEVTVWWLAQPDDQTMTPAAAVYDNHGPALTPVTATAFDSIRDEETELAGQVVAQKAVQEYYWRLKRDKDVGRAEYVDYVDASKADKLGSLSLIENVRSVDVIVCVTTDDEQLVDELETAYNEYDFERVKDLLNETKPLRVSIPIYRADSPEARVVTKLPPLAGRRSRERRSDSISGFFAV